MVAMNFKPLAKITALVVVAAGLWMLNPWRSIKHPPGVLVQNAPVQKPVSAVSLPKVEGWHLSAVAEYQLRARVLGTKRYHSGFGSDLVPVDVAVGWGKMSDQAVLDQFTLSMSNRFFFYAWDDAPAIPPDEIMRSAANNHIIAANDAVRKTIRSLIPGHIVTMRGYLVNATGPGGEAWYSSVRRDDTGNGACEVFYVTEATAVKSLAAEMDQSMAVR
jgi:hypothetical protein